MPRTSAAPEKILSKKLARIDKKADLKKNAAAQGLIKKNALKATTQDPLSSSRPLPPRILENRLFRQDRKLARLEEQLLLEKNKRKAISAKRRKSVLFWGGLAGAAAAVALRGKNEKSDPWAPASQEAPPTPPATPETTP